MYLRKALWIAFRLVLIVATVVTNGLIIEESGLQQILVRKLLDQGLSDIAVFGIVVVLTILSSSLILSFLLLGVDKLEIYDRGEGSRPTMPMSWRLSVLIIVSVTAHFVIILSISAFVSRLN